MAQKLRRGFILRAGRELVTVRAGAIFVRRKRNFQTMKPT
jgi:hypothetical protein